MIKEADLILPLFLCLILISLLSGKKKLLSDNNINK